MKAYILMMAVALVATPTFAHEVNSENRNKPVPESAQKAEKKADKPKPESHGGGLDKYGCHTNHSTGDYHCHR